MQLLIDNLLFWWTGRNNSPNELPYSGYPANSRLVQWVWRCERMPWLMGHQLKGDIKKQ